MMHDHGAGRLKRAALFAFICAAFARGAAADHPFDARRYAFEIFSEDERTLSKYAERVDEEGIAAILDEAWAELDSAAAKTAGATPESAKDMIRHAVHGPDGISGRFERKLALAAGAGDQPAGPAAKIKAAVRHPAVWGIAAAFAAALIWINRRRA